MKRAIKFRLVNLKTKKIVNYGDYSPPTKDIEVQQFTGLKDYNDKEIYEGDIVELHFPFLDSNMKDKTLAIVTYYENGFYLKSLNSDVFFQDTIYQFKNCRVIGNKFGNPELYA